MSEEDKDRSKQFVIRSVEQIEQIIARISDEFESYSWEKRWRILLVFARFAGMSSVLEMAFSAVAQVVMTGKRTRDETEVFMRDLKQHIVDDNDPQGPFLSAA